MAWKDKRHVNILTNMLSSPPKDNFYDENGKSLKAAILDYNRFVGYTQKYDHMTNL
jgi:hypothetical protein